MGEHEFPADAHYGVTSPARVAAVLAALREVDVEAATADARPATRLGRIFRRGGNRIHGARCDFNVGAVVAAYGEILGRLSGTNRPYPAGRSRPANPAG